MNTSLDLCCPHPLKWVLITELDISPQITERMVQRTNRGNKNKINKMINIDFNKGNGLVPVVIQDNNTLQVLMVGYMNEEAFEKTVNEGKVTFFSRSKNRLWTKGETSGNFLIVKEITSRL